MPQGRPAPDPPTDLRRDHRRRLRDSCRRHDARGQVTAIRGRDGPLCATRRSMIPAHDLSVRSGNGWTIVDTAGIEQTPGAHDIGAPLGIAEGTMVLVILRAGERWAPGRDT